MCAVRTVHLCSNAQWICWWPQQNTFLMCMDRTYVCCMYSTSQHQCAMDLLVATTEHISNVCRPYVCCMYCTSLQQCTMLLLVDTTGHIHNVCGLYVFCMYGTSLQPCTMNLLVSTTEHISNECRPYVCCMSISAAMHYAFVALQPDMIAR